MNASNSKGWSTKKKVILGSVALIVVLLVLFVRVNVYREPGDTNILGDASASAINGRAPKAPPVMPRTQDGPGVDGSVITALEAGTGARKGDLVISAHTPGGGEIAVFVIRGGYTALENDPTLGGRLPAPKGQ